MSLAAAKGHATELFNQVKAAALAQEVSALPWLSSQRSEALAEWRTSAWPTRKTEDWKYTSLQPLAEGDFLRFGTMPSTPVTSALCTIENLDADRVVFVNGLYDAELSTVPGSSTQNADKTATPVRFSEADDIQRALIKRHLDSIAKPGNSLFNALNTSWLEEGVFYLVPRSVHANRPLQVVHVTTSAAKPFSVAQRLLVVLEEHAEATVIEHFVSTDERQSSFVNGVTELQIGDGARLHHYRLHLEEEHALHIGSVNAQLQRNAQLHSFLLGLGSELKRIDLRVQHQGPGSHCQLNGVYLPRARQHIDVHSTVEHESPHGTTNEVFRGIVDDEATAVFNGRIHIHPHAQKTVAELSNKNLLLTNTAQVNTKPELEIYADDVRCAHGATVSQIEEQALYYMEARGIDRKEAEVMLSFGFINELLNELGLEPIRDLLRPVLTHWFGRDSQLTRHIE